MTDDQRWGLIADARLNANGNEEAHAAYIIDQLIRRPASEIIAFGHWVLQKMEAAEKVELLLIVTWIYDVNGLREVSCDGWEYWKAWLVSRGRDTYEAVLSDPDSVADFYIDFDEFLSGEPIECAAREAYEIATGREPPDEMREPSQMDRVPGYWCDEDVTPRQLERRFPRMAKKFGLPSFCK